MVTTPKKGEGVHVVSFLVNSNPMYEELYKGSRKKEINELNNLGCFEIAAAEEAKQYELNHTCFVDYVRYNATKRWHLCLAAYNDNGHGLFPAALMIRRLSLRPFLEIPAAEQLPLHARDVKKAFVMSKTSLCRPIYK